ncbi:MAG: hypothetical protein DRN30_03195 [Thermoplasmata archaeon]|nr:MAG: hypothetical protein DRN30_03195 [Thermoplasmata archaeon]
MTEMYKTLRHSNKRCGECLTFQELTFGPVTLLPGIGMCNNSKAHHYMHIISTQHVYCVHFSEEQEET